MPKYPSDKFEGSALEWARTAAGFSLDDLSNESGINFKYLAQLETGAKYPTNDEIKTLAEITGVLPKFFNQVWVKAPAHSWNFRNNI